MRCAQSAAGNEVKRIEARRRPGRLVAEWLRRDVAHCDAHAQLNDPHGELEPPPGPRLRLRLEEAVDFNDGVHL